MDLLINTITKIWEELGSDEYIIPIINIHFTDLFIAVLIVTVVIRSLNIILGGKGDKG